MNLSRLLKNKGGYDSVGKLVLSVGISLGLVVFSGLVILDTLNSFSEAYEKGKIVEKEEKKVMNLRLEYLKRRQHLDYVISNIYVENEARARFNYLKSGEVVFVLPQTGQVAGAQTKVEDNLDASMQREPIQEWLELLLN